MDLADWRRALQAFPDCTEGRPFGEGVLVYKTAGRIFALLTEAEPPLARLSLKCDPDRAQALRGQFAAVTPGYHLNKEHWNTIQLDGSVPPELLADLVEHSWELIVSRLKKAERQRLQMLREG